jgi:hypothetical protein
MLIQQPADFKYTTGATLVASFLVSQARVERLSLRPLLRIARSLWPVGPDGSRHLSSRAAPLTRFGVVGPATLLVYSQCSLPMGLTLRSQITWPLSAHSGYRRRTATPCGSGAGPSGQTRSAPVRGRGDPASDDPASAVGPRTWNQARPQATTPRSSRRSRSGWTRDSTATIRWN